MATPIFCLSFPTCKQGWGLRETPERRSGGAAGQLLPRLATAAITHTQPGPKPGGGGCPPPSTGDRDTWPLMSLLHAVPKKEG